MRKSLVVAALVVAAATSLAVGVGRAQEPSPPRRTLLHCGALLAAPGSPPLAARTLVVAGSKVTAVLEGYAAPEGTDEVVDLKQSFVLPGLIDCHVHLSSEYSADARLKRVEQSEADLAIQAVVHARRTLLAGFTTVRDLGSRGDAVFALRDAVKAGLVPGPRVLAAGHMVTPTGGHGDGTHGYREDLFPVPDALQGVSDGVAGCRQAVRAQVKRGADVIKLSATGGVLSATAAGTDQQFFADELQAIVDTARLLGRKVAAHAHGVNGIKAALRAGVDSIEHGTFLDDEAVALFKEKGAWYVPTLVAGAWVAEKAEVQGFFPPPVAEKARAVGPKIKEAVGRAWRGGVKIAFGTDSGVSSHGKNGREFALLVEAGLSPQDAIAAATVKAAELLGLQGTVGALAPGMAADVIATRRSPLEDVTELERVTFVMRDGVVHARP